MHEALEAYKPKNRTFVKHFEVPAGAKTAFPLNVPIVCWGFWNEEKALGSGNTFTTKCAPRDACTCAHTNTHTHTHTQRQSGATHKHVIASQGPPEPPWICWFFPGKLHPLHRRVTLKDWRFRAHSLAYHPSRVTWANDHVSPSSWNRQRWCPRTRASHSAWGEISSHLHWV